MAACVPQLGNTTEIVGETNWKLCVICQDTKDKTSVVNPRVDSYKNLLDSIAERADLQDGEFVQIHNRLKDYTEQILHTNKAVWHRVCYSDATNKVEIQRAMDRYENSMATGRYTPRERGRKSQKRKVSDISDPSPSTSATPYTRSATQPLNKDICFFCQENSSEELFSLRTENAGQSLKKAVSMSSNPAFITRLNTAITPGDAHAIDVKYHKQCWRVHVFHVLREETNENQNNKNECTKQTACFIELVNLVDTQTKNKAYLSMEDIETTYVNMIGPDTLANHVPSFSRRWLKEKLMGELPNLRSVLQANRRLSAVLYSPETCESDMVQSAIMNDSDSMNHVYKAAQSVRRSIMNFSKNTENSPISGSITVTSTVDDVPVELYSLIRWILVGPVEKLENEVRTRTVDRSSLTICQNIMYEQKSERQVTFKPKSPSVGFRPPKKLHENAQVVGLALTIHHKTRNKSLVDLLHRQGLCISYNRTMLLETSLANAVVKNTEKFDGLFVPPFLKKGTFVFFAADNADFREDTFDGKKTTHGTIVAVYQKSDATGEHISPPLQITDAQSLTVAPYHTPIIPCDKPKQKSSEKDGNIKFTINKEGISRSYKLTHLGWILSMAISRKDGKSSSIPGWAGYNALISEGKVVTNVGALPLMPELAHEWPTLLTVMIQARNIKNLAAEKGEPVVISFDMALYEKAVQLVDTRQDLKGTVFPRLGELHVVMAALRGLGSSIENSGIDDSWNEANVYGPATTRQILKCTHYKRALRAHIYTYVALYEMAFDEFFRENSHLKDSCEEATTLVEDACSKVNKEMKSECVKVAHGHLCTALTDLELMTEFHKWEVTKSKNAMFKAMMQYLHRVETILFFISASRNADVNLHLEAGEELSKLFFAMDRIKYKRLWPRYLADMHALKTDHPNTWKELELGNISVTKTVVPFVSIGADHACEHINKFMKVHSGLIGISNNTNARQRFFLTSPEMACMEDEFKAQFNPNETKVTQHHDLTSSAVSREHCAISKIKKAILSHGNPFAIEGHSIYNLITHAFVPDEYVHKILDMDDTGQKLYEEYVSERINGNVSLWAPVKKVKNQMYMSGNKKMAIKVRDKAIDLRETKDLYGRLMVLARSSREVKQKDAISNYEFTLTPRALFAPDGTALQCSDKSKLINDLNNLGKTETSAVNSQSVPLTSNEKTTDNTDLKTCWKIAVVDGMVIVQTLPKKKVSMENVKDLAECFVEKTMSLTRDYDEVIVVFDTYKADSLKNATREKRRGGKDPIKYQVRDETKIKHITLSRFLSHEQTKADLAVYLGEKTLSYNQHSPKVIITSAAGQTKSNDDTQFETNNHEEADTLLIHQAVLATKRSQNKDVELVFFSPDTDVLVLVISNYDLLPKNTSISMVSGVLKIEPIWTALGYKRAKALPAFHAFSGADNTGKFSGIGKSTWFKAFLDTDDEVMSAFLQLSHTEPLTTDTHTAMEKFVCAAYRPKKIKIESIPELRWYLFCKNMAESERLPPTLGALKEYVLRVQLQANVWKQASISTQEFLDPLQHGYEQKDDHLKPTTTLNLPAPKAIIEMVRCQCKSDCLSQRCSCQSKDLPCTDLCQCGADCENDPDIQCVNQESDDDTEDGTDEEYN